MQVQLVFFTRQKAIVSPHDPEEYFFTAEHQKVRTVERTGECHWEIVVEKGLKNQISLRNILSAQSSSSDCTFICVLKLLLA